MSSGYRICTEIFQGKQVQKNVTIKWPSTEFINWLSEPPEAPWSKFDRVCVSAEQVYRSIQPLCLSESMAKLLLFPNFLQFLTVLIFSWTDFLINNFKIKSPLFSGAQSGVPHEIGLFHPENTDFSINREDMIGDGERISSKINWWSTIRLLCFGGFWWPIFILLIFIFYLERIFETENADNFIFEYISNLN